MPSALLKEDRFAAFRHTAWVNYFAGRFLSSLALEIITVSVGWQIYDITRNPLDLGLIGLIQFMPALVLILVTGSVADRYGRRTIILICELVMALGAFGILMLTARGLTSVLPIFAIILILGIVRAFLNPAAQALAPNLVPAHDLPNSVAWNSTSWQVASVLGPAAGGLLYGIGPLVPYLTGLLILLVSAVFIYRVPRPPRRLSREPQTWDSLMAGFRYIQKDRIVLGAISLDLFAVLLGGAVALMPVFARDILDLGPTGLGLLRASPGVGAIFMAIYLASKPIRKFVGMKMFISVALFGLATVAFGFSTNLPVSLIALACIGAFDTVSVYVRQSLVQLWTPDELLGRVSAVNSVFVGASNELGDFRAGAMAAFLGPVVAVSFGGFAAVGIAITWVYAFPELCKIQSLDRERESSSG